jgi:seryl-tRNA synthetase
VSGSIEEQVSTTNDDQRAPLLPASAEPTPAAAVEGAALTAAQQIGALEQALVEQAATELALRSELAALRTDSEQQRVRLDQLLAAARGRVTELESRVETLARERNGARSQVGRLEAELRQAAETVRTMAAEREARAGAHGARLDQARRHLAAASALLADARPQPEAAVAEAAPPADTEPAAPVAGSRRRRRRGRRGQGRRAAPPSA